MFTARIRALAGMSLLASAIGLAAFGAATGTANAAPTHVGHLHLLRLRNPDVLRVL